MKNKKKVFPQNNVFILIAHGFDEKLILECLHLMRDAGISSSLVSLTPGVINELHGLKLHSDILIDQLPQTTRPFLVLIPGGTQCGTIIMYDPRAYQLIAKTMDNRGFVAATLETQSAVQEAGFPIAAQHPSLLLKNNLISRLVDLAIPDN